MQKQILIQDLEFGDRNVCTFDIKRWWREEMKGNTFVIDSRLSTPFKKRTGIKFTIERYKKTEKWNKSVSVFPCGGKLKSFLFKI